MAASWLLDVELPENKSLKYYLFFQDIFDISKENIQAPKNNTKTTKEAAEKHTQTTIT